MKRQPDPEQERKLEEWIQRELSQLPEHPAPPTLIPRVMAALEARSRRPWWQRSFSHWPRKYQAMMLVALSASAGWLIYGLGLVWPWIWTGPLVQGARQLLASVDLVVDVARVCSQAIELTLRACLTHPVAFVAMGLATAAYLSFIGLGSLWIQFATSKRSA